MTNELIVVNDNDLIEFDDNKIDLIKRTVAKDATNDELELFLYQCGRTGLDPLARQIHFQKFINRDGSSNVSFITTIDGYRLIAARTGAYAGNSEAEFTGRITIDDAGQYDKIKQAPAKATVTVYKFVNGVVCSFSHSVYWEEYYPGGKRGYQWRKMPHVMLAKCAEAGALRKAFPADLSNMYTNEEMNQAGVDIVPQIQQSPRDLYVDTIDAPVFDDDMEEVAADAIGDIDAAAEQDEPEANPDYRAMLETVSNPTIGLVCDYAHQVNGYFNAPQHAMNALNSWDGMNGKKPKMTQKLTNETAVKMFDWLIDYKSEA